MINKLQNEFAGRRERTRSFNIDTAGPEGLTGIKKMKIKTSQVWT